MLMITKFVYFVSAIGAINWGLVAFFNFNLVTQICGMVKIKKLDKIIYASVATAGLFTILSLFAL